MIARDKGGGDVTASPAGADRHPVAERLRDGDDIRTYRLVLEGEPTAGAPEPGLDLVQHEQDAPLVTQAPHRCEVAGGRDYHACFSFDGLQEDGGDRCWGNGLFEGAEVAVGDATESFWKRAERFVLLRLPGRGERRQGAPVERPQRRDDDVPTRATYSPGELDCAFVRLCTGVREEHLAPCRRAVTDKAVQGTGETLVELVGMPKGHHGDAGEEVEIPATLIVEQLGPPSRDKTDRRGRVRRHERGRGRLSRHCATTIVPTPSLVSSSSRIAWVTRPSST